MNGWAVMYVGCVCHLDFWLMLALDGPVSSRCRSEVPWSLFALHAILEKRLPNVGILHLEYQTLMVFRLHFPVPLTSQLQPLTCAGFLGSSISAQDFGPSWPVPQPAKLVKRRSRVDRPCTRCNISI